MSEPAYAQYSGKTLVLSWQIQQEWRVPIGDYPSAVSDSLHTAINQTGITSGLPGIIPDSIHVRVEE